MNDRLLLIDGMALVYRAFHAIPHLSTHNGVPTNAVLGFIKSLEQCQQVWQPSHTAVVFDGGIPPARRTLLPAYKMQRPPMPDAMRAQLPLINNYLACANLPAVRLEQQEADDVMAALAARAQAAGMETLVATSDKDLMQIVSERIHLITPGKVNQRIDPTAVRERTGVTPAQIVDWLALIGDTADNIPGVPGVGPKTAAHWLEQWRSLEGIFEHQSLLQPEKCRQALAENMDVVQRNRRLMQLETNLDGLPTINDFRRQAADKNRLLQFYRECEFNSLARPLAEPTLF